MDRQKQLKRVHVFVVLFVLSFVLLGLQQKFFKQEIVLFSPLPDFLTYFKNDQVTTLSLWFPLPSYVKGNADNLQKPEITAKSALVYDLTTNKVLYEKNTNEKLPMASLTKIMTAIVGLENYRADKKFRVEKEDLVGENSLRLAEGEVLTFEELLYGLILVSGNDASEAIARGFAGGRGAFIKAMNNKAKTLGALNTNFTNPSGLEGDGMQYTTAYDMLIITKYAMEFDLFEKVIATVDYHIPRTQFHKEYRLYNETNLLTSYSGVKGIKAGYTSEAGLCLVTYLDYSGHEIVGIILGSENRRAEMKQLLDYSLKIQGVVPPSHE